MTSDPFAFPNASVDAEAYRFNNRNTDDGTRFRDVIKNVSGKRLDYQTLIGKNISGPFS